MLRVSMVGKRMPSSPAKERKPDDRDAGDTGRKWIELWMTWPRPAEARLGKPSGWREANTATSGKS